MEEFEDGDDLAGVFQPPCDFYNNHYISAVDFIPLFSICVLEKRLVYVLQVDCGTVDAL